MNQEELYRLVHQLNPKETIVENLGVLTYEIGDLAKCIMHREWLKSNHQEGRHQEESAYVKEAQKAISDAITQLRIICVRLGISYLGCRMQGEEAIKSRFQKLKDQGWIRE